MADFDPDQFREDFPEFADDTKFPDGSLSFWADIADKQLNATRWGDLLLHGIELFVAHNITLQAMNVASANVGQAPGTGAGLISQQSAGSVSMGIDTQASIEDKGGNWNLTLYGTQLIRLARITGIGGLQL